MQVGYEKIAIFDQYLYLGNDTREGHNYYGMPIGTLIRSIECWYFQRL